MSILFFIFLLKTILFYSFFLFSILWDFRKRSLPKLLLLFYSLVGIPLFLFSLWQDFFQGPFQLSLPFLYSFYPFLFSFLLFLFAKCSKGALGCGDGLFLLCCAFYLNYKSFLFLFLSGLICSALVSMLLFLFSIKMKKNWKNMSFPFIPCFIPAGVYFFVLLFTPRA